jgi:Trk K+ transport system NAD-binding subunit
LVCGDDSLAYQVVTQLVEQYEATVTVLLPSAREHFGPRIAQLASVRMVEADPLDANAFRRAGIEAVAGVALMGLVESANTDAALLIQDLNPDVRIVLRMNDLALAARFSALLTNGVAISDVAIAAPAFSAAALDDSRLNPVVQIAGRQLYVARRSEVRAADIVCGLAAMAGQDAELLGPEDAAEIVLTRSVSRRVARRRSAFLIAARLVVRRLAVVVAILGAVMLVGAAALASVQDLSWWQAIYLSLLSMRAGVTPEMNAPVVEQVVQAAFTVVSVALFPVVTVIVAESLVSVRLAMDGTVPIRAMRNHVVVGGLGRVGDRVLRGLHAAGIDVVGIDVSTAGEGAQMAADLNIPVVTGDFRQQRTLAKAGVALCRAVIFCSNDDLANVEAGLRARSINPDVRLVLELMDSELARRVQRFYGINVTRSAAYLAAPSFVAAMMGRQVVATIPIRRRLLHLAEVPVGAGSQIENLTCSEVDRDHAVRLIAVSTHRGDQVLWRPAGGRRLTRADTMIVVSTRAGLAEMLRRAHPSDRLTDPPWA